MVTFSKTAVKELQTVGELLRATRLGYGLTLNDISQSTMIRSAHLESLERNMCDRGLEPIYREKFLKNYSTYLGLDWDIVRSRYAREQEVYCSETKQHAHREPLQNVKQKHLWVTARIVQNSIFGTLLGGVVAYLLFLGYTTFHAPELLVYSPPDNLSSTVDKVLVSGKAHYDAGILINGRAISKDKDGGFHTEVDLKDGLNVIQVSAIKKYGQEQTIKRTVIVNRGEQARAY